MTDIPKLYTSSEKIAEIWRKEYPGVEIVMTERLPITDTPNSIRDILEDFIDSLVNSYEASAVGEITEAQNEELVDEYQSQAEQAINAYILGEVMELIGADEYHIDDSFAAPRKIVTAQKMYRNQLKAELRNKANEKWGK